MKRGNTSAARIIPIENTTHSKKTAIDNVKRSRPKRLVLPQEELNHEISFRMNSLLKTFGEISPIQNKQTIINNALKDVSRTISRYASLYGNITPKVFEGACLRWCEKNVNGFKEREKKVLILRELEKKSMYHSLNIKGIIAELERIKKIFEESKIELNNNLINNTKVKLFADFSRGKKITPKSIFEMLWREKFK